MVTNPLQTFTLSLPITRLGGAPNFWSTSTRMIRGRLRENTSLRAINTSLEFTMPARQLAVPMLRTFMTKAHAMETEKSNRGRDTIDGYGYFDSLLDIAADSLASDEIRRLTDE